MRLEIFLSTEMGNVLKRKASELGLTTPAYTTCVLEEYFADELPGPPAKGYIQLFNELRDAVFVYKNSLEPGTLFTLREVPYYVELGIDSEENGLALPVTKRARLGRSINKEIEKSNSPMFADVERATTKSGKPAVKKGAAVYRKI